MVSVEGIMLLSRIAMMVFFQLRVVKDLVKGDIMNERKMGLITTASEEEGFI